MIQALVVIKSLNPTNVFFVNRLSNSRIWCQSHKTFFSSSLAHQMSRPEQFVLQGTFQPGLTFATKICKVWLDLGPWRRIHNTSFSSYIIKAPNNLVSCFWEAFLVQCNVTLQLIGAIRVNNASDVRVLVRDKVMSRYVTSRCVTLRHVTSLHVTSCHITSHS